MLLKKILSPPKIGVWHVGRGMSVVLSHHSAGMFVALAKKAPRDVSPTSLSKTFHIS